MAISSSQRLQIIEALLALFRNMSDATVYNYPVTNDEAVTDDPTFNLLTANGSDLPYYVLEPTPGGSKDYYPGEHLVETLLVNVHVRYDAEEANAHARTTVWENIAADIEIAVASDLTLGGLVVDTRLGVAEPFVGVGSKIVILVQPLRMQLHRHYGAP